MQFIILAPALYTNANGAMLSLYPSNIPSVTNQYGKDLIEACLRNAKNAGFKVWLGLNFDEKWWGCDYRSDWLMSQMHLGNQVAKELIDRYKSNYPETLYGWYWVWEVDNISTPTLEYETGLAKAININRDYLKEISPDMPFMLCPFFNYRLGSSAKNESMWKNVFRQTNFKEGDVFAPQDCIGAGGLELSNFVEWFAGLKRAVDTKPGLQFWVDTETFDQRFWTSATIDRFVKQMELLEPYVSNYITFAYSHYYSPNYVNPGFHADYMYYLKNKKLPYYEVIADIQHTSWVKLPDGNVEYTWSVKEGPEVNVAGYFIFLNGELVKDWQYRPNRNLDRRHTFKNSELKATNSVVIVPYGASGKQGLGKQLTGVL